MELSATNPHQHLADSIADSLTESEFSLLLDLIAVPEKPSPDSPVPPMAQSSSSEHFSNLPSPDPRLPSQFRSSNPTSSRKYGKTQPVTEQVIDIISEDITSEPPLETPQTEFKPKATYPTTSLLEELGLVAPADTKTQEHNGTTIPSDHANVISSPAALSLENTLINAPINLGTNSEQLYQPKVTSHSLIDQLLGAGEETTAKINPTSQVNVPNNSPIPADLSQNLDISLLQTILTPPEMDRVGASLEDLSERLKRIENQVYSPELQNKLDSFESQLNDRLNDQSQQDALNQLTNNLDSLSQGYHNIPLMLKELDQRLDNLEENIFDADKLLELVQSIWLKLNHQVMAQHTNEITASFVAIIDNVIHQRITENPLPLSQALAEIISEVIQLHVSAYPDQIAIAIAPEIATAVKEQSRIDQRAIIEALGPQMGAAIKQQILLERDAMVDALYPVIGNTISKYLTEAIREINQRVENAFSLAGLSRKIRARLQGVSEAELILRESFPFEIRAIFLIEKYSGLVMVDLQASEYKTNSAPLEGDMIAGMLTAIRSFVSDCLSRSAQVTEIDAIEYGQAKILIEVTGYSYLAVIVEGQPPKDFIHKMRHILGKITQKYEKELKNYDGDPRMIPSEVKNSLASLMEYDVQRSKGGGNFNIAYILGALFLGGLGWAGWQTYQQMQWQQLEQKISYQWQNNATVSLYRLSPKVTAERVILNGYVPNEGLKQQAQTLAEQVIRAEQLDMTLDNRVVVMEAPRNPKDTAVEVQRLVQSFNQTLGRTPNFGLRAQFRNGQVILSGTVSDAATAQKISQSFSQVPGVRSVTNTLIMRPVTITTQIYFVEGESDMKLSDLPKLIAVTNFLDRYPDYQLKILGSSDPRGDFEANYRLALRRAQSVEKELIKRGIAKERLVLVPVVLNPAANSAVNGDNNLTGSKSNAVPEWMLRRVEFLLVPPVN
jgi:outer membrane protein OmpA-like peptidoglycan-associated protein